MRRDNIDATTTTSAADDEKLIHRALAGDRNAYSALAARHRQRIAAVAFRALGNADDAQDVAQEAFLYAYQRLPELRERSKFSAWIAHITLTLCTDYRRRRGTRRLGEPITVLNEASEDADYAERLAVRQALEHLSEAHRTTVLLHYVGGWSLEEVANLLSLPINTVRSRLMAAKRYLRADLGVLPTPPRIPMLSSDTFALTEAHTSLLDAAFPSARILSVQSDPEPWMPFSRRVRLALPDGEERTVDIRNDVDPDLAARLPVLDRLGIPGPRLIHGPVSDGEGGYRCVAEVPRGDNLLLWALGGTPHRIRLATERAFESIDRLQGITDALLADPIGQTIPRRTLADEVARIDTMPHAEGGDWRTDPWFAAALAKVRTAVADIHDPLVYTDYLHFFPNFVRVHPEADPFNEPLGWPGDIRLNANPIAEYVTPQGHIGDPLLGLTMVWIYDCYPFVHTGFVEQFLWRRGVSRREFAPRLALRALQEIQRALPVARPAKEGEPMWEGGTYWDSLRGYVEQGLAWM